MAAKKPAPVKKNASAQPVVNYDHIWVSDCIASMPKEYHDFLRRRKKERENDKELHPSNIMSTFSFLFKQIAKAEYKCSGYGQRHAPHLVQYKKDLFSGMNQYTAFGKLMSKIDPNSHEGQKYKRQQEEWQAHRAAKLDMTAPPSAT